MLSAISRSSSCTRSAISSLFKARHVARKWHPTPQICQFSQRGPTSTPRIALDTYLRAFSTSPCNYNASSQNSRSSSQATTTANEHGATTSSSTGSSSTPTAQANSSSEPGIEQEPKMAIAFTCTVPDCGHRQAHVFSKRSYERGIVIVTCDNCKNR
jgi:protein import protein ZIM17